MSGDETRFDLWLAREMEKREWDIFDVELESGLNHETVKSYLKGTRLPTMSSLLLLLDAFGKRMVIVDK